MYYYVICADSCPLKSFASIPLIHLFPSIPVPSLKILYSSFAFLSGVSEFIAPSAKPRDPLIGKWDEETYVQITFFDNQFCKNSLRQGL